MMLVQLGANTQEVTEAVERALNELKPAFATQDIALHEGLFRPANFIRTAIANVRFSLVLGGVLVAIVLFLFLFNFRTAAISFAAIPLSLLGAVIVLDKLGITLNTLTLGGLAIAIGEVVDDAVIDVENILRRLRENGASATARPVFRVVLEASLEVRSAVVYATFIVALVFLPCCSWAVFRASSSLRWAWPTSWPFSPHSPWRSPSHRRWPSLSSTNACRAARSRYMS